MDNKQRPFDLQERLIEFAVMVIAVSNDIPPSAAGKLLADDLLRSGTHPALHYGEAQAAESRRDFIHKMKVALKELREAHACLRIILKAKLFRNEQSTEACREECSELIAIFQASVNSAQSGNK